MIKLKNDTEISRIRESGEILAETFRLLSNNLGEGVSTEDLDHLARDFIEKNGARPAFLGYHDYPASICSSVNNVVIHGIPDSRKLKEGDILSLDLGVDLAGYISDAAYTYPVGKVSPKVEELLRTTQECLHLGIEKAVNGNRIHDISRSIFEHAKSRGYGVVHQFCGHGVGFALHEDPQVPNYISKGPNPRLKPGMVLALEPMITLGADDVMILEDDWTVVTVDESLAAHFEHSVAIHSDRTEILTPIGDGAKKLAS